MNKNANSKVSLRAARILDYVKANGRKVQVFSEGGGPESGPDLSLDFEGIRLGNLWLIETEEGIALFADNRHLKRTQSAFVQNEPERSGAVVEILNTFPDYPF